MISSLGKSVQFRIDLGVLTLNHRDAHAHSFRKGTIFMHKKSYQSFRYRNIRPLVMLLESLHATKR
jgi:hypothetical protein